jgi:predicted RecB family nuclease
MKLTSELFGAFLKCPTKCYLRSTGQVGSGNAYAEWVREQSDAYRKEGVQRLVTAAGDGVAATTPGSDNLKTATWQLAVDFPLETETMASRLHAVERVPPQGRGRPAQFIPVRFVFFNKLTKDDRLLVAFDALVLSEVLGREVSTGKIVHGDDHATSKVKVASLLGTVPKLTAKISAMLDAGSPPDLILNRHCGECEFRDGCRQKALEKDDLSLLGGMTATERKNYQSKGIFTVTQLSYTFRPRRRPKYLRNKREKYHHSLKALALRQGKIHLVGNPKLRIEGTPVYLDVESLPDRDFYYLIGLRIGNGESARQQSLWADTLDDEAKIWNDFIGIVTAIERPVIIHYGSFESTFLNRMETRFPATPETTAVLQAVRKGSVNLLNFIYGQVYFPTHSNGLKDVAGFLGFRWPDSGGSGPTSVIWRRRWEESRVPELRQKLEDYNAADCEACERLCTAFSLLPSAGEIENRNEGFAFVTNTLPNAFSHPDWQTFKGVLPELDPINEAAQWDYQRDRIYLRKRDRSRKAQPEVTTHKKLLCATDKVVAFPASSVCPTCHRRSKHKSGTQSVLLHDLLFGRSSIKRRAVRHDFQKYWCPHCRSAFGVDERFRSWKFGWNFIAVNYYMTVELGIPQEVASKLLQRLFGVLIPSGSIGHVRTRVAAYYEETTKKIVEKITSGHVVHADETRARKNDGAGYVWVFAGPSEVVYTHSESREADVTLSLLKGFRGVLVSDFYAGYEGMDCPQQKCLIHLIRDLNNEVLAHPYDEELKRLVRDFASLLRPIINTIDHYGLKRRFMNKHLKDVNCFYRQLAESTPTSEPALGFKQRLERNRDKLFTFLKHDGVPWNNNNAEHAVKAYTRRFRAIACGASSPKAIKENLILLSVCESCRYMGVDFLDFLRSGEKDIHAFAESRQGRRRRQRPIQPTALPVDECNQE